MGIGLNITSVQFNGMTRKDKDSVMFENIVYIRDKMDNYKVTKRVQYVWLSVLTAFVGVRKLLWGI